MLKVRIAVALVGGSDGKEEEGIFWGDGDVLYLDLGYCYAGT